MSEPAGTPENKDEGMGRLPFGGYNSSALRPKPICGHKKKATGRSRWQVLGGNALKEGQQPGWAKDTIP
jgi:hypothetical protein